MSKIKFILIFLAVFCFAFGIAKAQETTKITLGSEYVFNYASTSLSAIAGMSSDKLVIAYQDGTSSFDYGTAIIGEISGNEVAFGSEYVFNETSTYYISIASLSETRFVVAYQDTGNSKRGTAIIGEISGNEVAFGSEYVFDIGATKHISVTALSADKIAVFYQDRADLKKGKAVIGEISGNEITFGSEYVFNIVETKYISAVALSEDKVAVAYQDTGGYNYGTVIVGTVSGNEITFGSEHVFKPGNVDYIDIDKIASDKFVAAYRDVYLGHGVVITGEIVNDEITFSLEYIFNTAATDHLSIIALSEDRVAIAYRDRGYNSYGTAVIGEISDSGITFGSEYVFNTTVTYYTSIDAMANNKFAVAYQDKGSNTNFGTVAVGSIPVEEIIEEEEIVEEEIVEEATTLADGDLVRNSNAEGMAQFDIYIVKIVNSKKFKRLILSPHVFESYAHFDKNGNGSPWDDVIDVNQTTMDQYTTSDLVRADGDTKVYQLVASDDTGSKRLISATDNDFPSYYDLDSVYTINATDRDAYQES